MLQLVILRFLESYFRHRWLYLVPIVLMIATAGIYFATAEPAYVSRGTLYVRKESLLASLTQVRQDGFSWNTAANLAVIDITELTQTESFVRAVIEQTDLRTYMSDPELAEQIIIYYRESLEVSAMGENLIQFSVSAGEPATAQQLASATINVYKQWKLNIDEQDSRVAQAFFADLIPPYRAELEQAQNALQEYLALNPDPVRGDRPTEERIQLDKLQAAIDLAATRLQNAVEKEEAARLAMTQAEAEINQSYQLIDAPNLPDEPDTSLKDVALMAGIFIAVGTILSLFGIVGGALLDRTIRLPIDVRRSLELPLLAMVSDSTARHGRRTRGRQAGARPEPALAAVAEQPPLASQVAPVEAGAPVVVESAVSAAVEPIVESAVAETNAPVTDDRFITSQIEVDGLVEQLDAETSGPATAGKDELQDSGKAPRRRRGKPAPAAPEEPVTEVALTQASAMPAGD